jgi:hypothetical protein
LLAILDMILVGHSRTRPSSYLPVKSTETLFRGEIRETATLIDKLRKLRDRVAHRAGHAALAAEIREELREVMRDRLSSAGCLIDD